MVDPPYVEKLFGTKPILRLAGGKQHLTRRLVGLLPPGTGQYRYVEPCLGGGSLFFALGPPVSRLNDLSPFLVHMYRHIRDDPESVHQELVCLAEQHAEDFYYRVRDSFNRAEPSIGKSAQFIYLNRSCYNGVLRVNQKSEFNVSWGKKGTILIPTLADLRHICEVLANSELSQGDYAPVLLDVGRGDFVYLDPPYPPVSQTAKFRQYTARTFSLDDHRNLGNWARQAADRGAHVMISNADTLAIRVMYEGWHLTKVWSPRHVTSKKSRVRRTPELMRVFNGSGVTLGREHPATV